MKAGSKLLSCGIGLFALKLVAADVRLGWDPSPTAGVTNYVLYGGTNALAATNALVRVYVGTNLTARLDDLQPGRWQFAVSAMKDGLESDICAPIQVESPAKPGGLRTVAIQYSTTLTNWSDIGFFKLRIP